MEHPAADHAKAVMQVAAAGTGVRLSRRLDQRAAGRATRAAVHAAWRLHARLVRRSLERGFYQGWDLHPAQLPTRYAATYAFYRDGLPSAAARLRAYVGQRSDSGSSTNRRPPSRWPASSCGRSSAARSVRPSSPRTSVSNAPAWPSSRAVARPDSLVRPSRQQLV